MSRGDSANRNMGTTFRSGLWTHCGRECGQADEEGGEMRTVIRNVNNAHEINSNSSTNQQQLRTWFEEASLCDEQR